MTNILRKIKKFFNDKKNYTHTPKYFYLYKKGIDGLIFRCKENDDKKFLYKFESKKILFAPSYYEYSYNELHDIVKCYKEGYFKNVRL